MSQQRAREALLRIPPPERRGWTSPAALRVRRIDRPWEGGHSLAWLAWIGAAAWCASLTTNPLYLLLFWATALLIWSSCGRGRSVAWLLKLGAILLAFQLIFALITASTLIGETRLWTLPELRLPDLLGGLRFGGPVTLEPLLVALVKGAQLWTLLLSFGTFNAGVNHYRLLRRSPRFLFQAGLAVTIALAFVPQTVARLQAIRDAQRLRGHRFRSWRDALPLLSPLISSGLERALMLAEAMEARGYGHTLIDGQRLRRMQLLSLGGVLLLLLGCTGVLLGSGAVVWLGLLGLLGGVLLLGGTWWWISRWLPRTTYRRERWSRADAVVVLAAALAALGMRWIAWRAYWPFPRAAWPLLDLRVLLVTGLLALPALVWARPPAA